MKTLHYFITIMSLIAISNGMVFAYGQVASDYGGHAGFYSANFKSADGTFSIWYKITNAVVTSTPMDLAAKKLIFFINATNDGQLIIELPRSMIDYRIQDTDQPFFITMAEKNTGISKINATETDDNYTRILKINFTKNTYEIEIVGNLFAAKYPISKTHSILSPMLQNQLGIPIQNIQCISNFHLIFKSKDGSPACVRPESVSVLVQRGWARQELYHVIHVEPKITLNDYSYNGIDKQDNMTILINNQTYHQTTLDYSAYDLPKALLIQFQNVIFTFPGGTQDTSGGAVIMLDVKFQDGFEEIYDMQATDEFKGINVPSQHGSHMAENSTTILSNHMEPQAGMTIYHDKIRLLVSK